jgi:formylglycine-generating enzyme
MLHRLLFFLLLPACALAQPCDCCKIRDLGQQKYNAGDYTGAKSTWETAKKMTDAAKCTDLDALITKAKQKIPSPPKPRPKVKKKTQAPTAASKKDNSIPSPVTHGKKSGLTMVPVEGGTFTMGSPENEADRDKNECQHRVTVNHFSIGQYEVTQADWKEVMGSNPSGFKNCDDCPVEEVSWNEVQEFIKAANSKYGRNFRLPTEAEWEYAARGGKKSRGLVYSGSFNLDEVAWYSDNSGSKTHAVGLKKANELGLYDMSGNVYEWCYSPYGPYPGCAEPEEIDENLRILRGGFWNGLDSGCRVSRRGGLSRISWDNGVGFRLAQD